MDKRLFDLAIDKVNVVLERHLSWLEKAYGRTVRRGATKIDSRTSNPSKGREQLYYYPSLYKEDGEYMNMLPSDSRKNVCFWQVHDAQTVDDNMTFPRLTAKVSCIFWVKLTDIYAEADYEYTENIKEDILDALKVAPYVNVKKIYEEPKNVFSDYAVSEVPVQFQMFPYYSIKVEMEMTVQMGCRE